MSNENKNNIDFYDNPLKVTGREDEHDILEAKHFDKEAEELIIQEDVDYFRVKMDEPLPPRRRAFWDEIGDPSGMRILDVGCGYGYAACKLAMMGADVYAIDVSPKMCDLASYMAKLNNVQIDISTQSASNTGFPDDFFDMIIGQVSLHHLILDSAGPELKRILKPDMKAIFVEPIHNSKFMYNLRKMIPVSYRESEGGGALRIDEIQNIGDLFGYYKIIYFAIFERILRFKALSFLTTMIYAIDNLILKLPGTKKLAAHALIILKKRVNKDHD